MSDPNDMVTVVDRNGAATDIPTANLAEYQRQGWSVEGADARANRVGEEQRSSDSSGVEAALQGGARGVTFGGSDVAQRLLGGEDARRHLESLQKYHGTLSAIGELAGGLAAGGVAGRLGSAASELAGGGLAGGILGGATEGAAYGVGSGVSQLALSDDPLTAEHIASTLGSNIMLGGATGGILGGASKLVERGLVRAGDKLAETAAARSALESVPEDLSNLDEKGLSDAMKSAKAEHAGDAVAERQSLEDIRTNKRTEIAHDVQDLHEDLATERPIYSSLTKADGSSLNPALKGIDGVQDAQVQLAKSYKALRSRFDNMLSVESNPEQLIAPLQQRQGALEALQEKMPEIHAALAGEAKAAQLVHVDDALEQTKAQIDAIRSLNSRTNPVSSGRLAMLEAGPSQRMVAIDAAKEALKKAPELGMVGKGATAAAFAGGTALAHMIPGVGMLAPFVGKGASDAVGSLFRRLAGAHQEILSKTAASTERLMSTGARAASKAVEIAPRTAAATATATLGAVRFGEDAAASGSSLPDLYKARSQELRQQTEFAPDGSVQMRPEARQALAAKLDPIRTVNPLLADKLETVIARRTSFLSSKLPRQPQVGSLQIGPDTWRPSDLQIRSWARSVRGAEDPTGVEERLSHGIITPEEAEAYRACCPERFAALQTQIFALAPRLSKTLPTNKKVALSVFTGVPCMPALQPNILKVLQGTFGAEPGSAGGTQAPNAQPNFGALGSLKSVDKPTAAQARES